jgi:hypothetical protein
MVDAYIVTLTFGASPSFSSSSLQETSHILSTLVGRRRARSRSACGVSGRHLHQATPRLGRHLHHGTPRHGRHLHLTLVLVGTFTTPRLALAQDPSHKSRAPARGFDNDGLIYIEAGEWKEEDEECCWLKGANEMLRCLASHTD